MKEKGDPSSIYGRVQPRTVGRRGGKQSGGRLGRRKGRIPFTCCEGCMFKDVSAFELKGGLTVKDKVAGLGLGRVSSIHLPG